MTSEDKTLRAENDSANRQTLLYGMGDQHLDIIVNKLKDRYKVDIELSKPKVPFRETIRKNSDVEGKHKNSPADTDSMVMLKCVLHLPVIWKHHMSSSR